MDNISARTDELWNALSDELRAFLRSRLPDESDADDLLQDVFLRVLEKVGSLRQTDRIEPWVYQIARNAIVDFYRRRAPRLAVTAEEFVDPDTHDRAGNQNQAVGTWLSLMIGELTKPLQDAVRLYEVDGLSQSEIANRMNISLSGAKSRVQRGKRQLAELLMECCQLDLDRRGNVIECMPAKPNCCAELSCGCNGVSSKES